MVQHVRMCLTMSYYIVTQNYVCFLDKTSSGLWKIVLDIFHYFWRFKNTVKYFQHNYFIYISESMMVSAKTCRLRNRIKLHGLANSTQVHSSWLKPTET